MMTHNQKIMEIYRYIEEIKIRSDLVLSALHTLKIQPVAAAPHFSREKKRTKEKRETLYKNSVCKSQARRNKSSKICAKRH